MSWKENRKEKKKQLKRKKKKTNMYGTPYEIGALKIKNRADNQPLKAKKNKGIDKPTK